MERLGVREGGGSQGCARPVGVCSPQPAAAPSASVLPGPGSGWETDGVHRTGASAIIGDLEQCGGTDFHLGRLGGARVSAGDQGGVSSVRSGKEGGGWVPGAVVFDEQTGLGDGLSYPSSASNLHGHPLRSVIATNVFSNHSHNNPTS